ncbi:MAG: hypothetical protein VB071_13495 [Lawsonibacter sp.]|nr:hypothetical protein [Lawsonibacter sp.]
MESFRVIEVEEGIEQAILRNLSARGGAAERCVSLNHPTLLVVSPKAAARGLELPGACRTVLLPGDAGSLLDSVRAASAVSYGASPRDSLTISSRENGKLWAALQRELVTIGGQVVERQEFRLTLAPETEELPALAVAGALLLLGVPPEELERRGSVQ